MTWAKYSAEKKTSKGTRIGAPELAESKKVRLTGQDLNQSKRDMCLSKIDEGSRVSEAPYPEKKGREHGSGACEEHMKKDNSK
jgi:hypothetical protein